MEIVRLAGFEKTQTRFRKKDPPDGTDAIVPGENGSSERISTNGHSSTSSVANSIPSWLESSDSDELTFYKLKSSSIHALLGSVPEIRQGRVVSVRASLKSGKYAVTDRQIARAMLRDFFA